MSPHGFSLSALFIAGCTPQATPKPALAHLSGLTSDHFNLGLSEHHHGNLKSSYIQHSLPLAMSRFAHSFLTASTFSISLPARIKPRPSFFSTLGALSKSLPPRPKPPPDSEIEESYLKGSGPGGQKINKTNSAVQLKHIPTGIVVKSQATRSRSQNRKLAREILAQRVDEYINGDQSRSAIVGAVKKKKADSAAKKSRRKYRLLEEEKAGAEATAAIENFEAEIPEPSSDIRQDASSRPVNSTDDSGAQSKLEPQHRGS
ncbi:RF-1 domain-containing protein [Trichoderma chlorosporum]